MDDWFDIADFAKWLREPVDAPEGGLAIPFPDELDRLLGAVRVTERTDDAEHGEFWSVYAHSFTDENSGRFSAVLRIEPRPDHAHVVTEGLRLALRSDDGICYLAADATDHRGQIWFRDLPPGRYCAVSDKTQLYSMGESSTLTCSRAAAASIQEDLLSFYAEDRRIRVHVERSSKTGRAVLTVCTGSQDLANTTVQFIIGGILGEMLLKPTGGPMQWESSRELGLRFSDAVDCVPCFSVVLRTGRGTATLVQDLRDGDDAARDSAVEALGKIGSEEAVVALIQALQDERNTVRVRVADALGRIGSQQATLALVQILRDEDDSVRKSAVEALGKIGSEEVVPALIQALKDAAAGVRSGAASSLGRIGSALAVPALERALETEKDTLVRVRLTEALQSFL